VGEAIYAPCALSSLAKVGSTKLILVVTFFALSLGTLAPQLLQYIVSLCPFPPFDRPRLFLFLVKAELPDSRLLLNLYRFGGVTLSCKGERGRPEA
jgi:hypothetical protein